MAQGVVDTRSLLAAVGTRSLVGAVDSRLPVPEEPSIGRGRSMWRPEVVSERKSTTCLIDNTLE